MAGLIISIFAVFVILLYWHRQGFLGGRYKYLIPVVLIGVLLSGVAANWYVWKSPIPKECMENDKYYSSATESCVSIINVELCQSYLSCLIPQGGNVFICQPNCTRHFANSGSNALSGMVNEKTKKIDTIKPLHPDPTTNQQNKNSKRHFSQQIEEKNSKPTDDALASPKTNKIVHH